MKHTITESKLKSYIYKKVLNELNEETTDVPEASNNTTQTANNSNKTANKKVKLDSFNALIDDLTNFTINEKSPKAGLSYNTQYNVRTVLLALSLLGNKLGIKIDRVPYTLNCSDKKKEALCIMSALLYNKYVSKNTDIINSTLSCLGGQVKTDFGDFFGISC